VVRFVKIIGVLALLGFLVYAIMPGYNKLLEIMNSTALTNLTGMTALEYTEWKLLPVIIIALIVIAVIWHYFRQHEGGEE